jgi:hypothetical protein
MVRWSSPVNKTSGAALENPSGSAGAQQATGRRPDGAAVVMDEVTNLRGVNTINNDYRKKLQMMQHRINTELRPGGKSGFASCRLRQLENGFDFCSSKSATLLYYNPLKRDRFLCGMQIPPESAVFLKDAASVDCNEPVTLFPVTPSVTGEGLPDIELHFHKGGHKKKGSNYENCDVPCMSYGSPGIVAERFVEAIDGSGDKWRLTFSMEGPQYYGQLFIDSEGWKSNHFWSTTSYHSEVPLPYFSWAEYNLHEHGPVNYDTAIHAALFLARNCHSKNHREQIIQEMEKSTFRVDSLSACLHNRDPPKEWNMSNKLEIMRRYLFYFAFENQNVDDYITEKLWGPIVAGTVPIYFGASNVKEHVPDNSIIVVQDFATTAELAEHLVKVAASKELYESYHSWRSKPLPDRFHVKYDFTHVHSTCRTCRWAYARQYGFGWNHVNQTVRETIISRKVCLQQGKIHKPFEESWWSAAGEAHKAADVSDTSSSSCQLDDKNRVLLVDDFRIRRTVTDYDGVIDLLLERTTKDSMMHQRQLILKLATPLQGTPIWKSFENGSHWRLQDNQSRFTFLTWPKAVLTMAVNGGTVSMTIPADAYPVSLRIITEDVDTFHDGADQEENPFGKLMIQDFFNPAELFVQET